LFLKNGQSLGYAAQALVAPLHYLTVPTIDPPAHAAFDATSVERLSIEITCLLNSSVRVMDQSFGIRAVTQRHGKRIERKTRLIPM
jgi:hypothetical protein